MLANGYIPGSTYTMLLPEGTPGDDPVKSWRPSVQSVPSQEKRLQACDAIKMTFQGKGVKFENKQGHQNQKNTRLDMVLVRQSTAQWLREVAASL